MIYHSIMISAPTPAGLVSQSVCPLADLYFIVSEEPQLLCSASASASYACSGSLILILIPILIFVTCANGGPICHSSWLLQLQLQLPLQLGHGRPRVVALLSLSLSLALLVPLGASDGDVYLAWQFSLVFSYDYYYFPSLSLPLSLCLFLYAAVIQARRQRRLIIDYSTPRRVASLKTKCRIMNRHVLHVREVL